MKLTQVFWLANRNFTGRKRRSLLLVLGLAVWFALVFIMWLWLTGCEQSYQHFAGQATWWQIWMPWWLIWKNLAPGLSPPKPRQP